jgi:hypothetical protein
MTPLEHENLITTFAKTNFRNKQVAFGIKTDDRRRHMYIIGKTGMGKTTLMENMVIQDIQNGHGVAFLDPHGDSVQKILDCVPSSRVNDVIYFNPADLDHPMAFNILESVDIKYKHLVASGLMGVFTKIWANLWSARMEYILNNTILALLDSPGNTMLGITRMYVDKKYRKKIVDNIKDPMVRAFWVDEYANYAEKYRTEAVAPIQNKVGQFLSSGIIRNIVGQPKSTIDMREIMDQKKILIMDLSKGKVGEDNSALLGAMLVTKIQLAAMSRTDVPEKDREDFYLYVDEFQNFATESFATILSEARKYRLNLIVGHQYIGQLVQDKSTKVRDAIFGNVGTLVVFRVGAEDAEFLVKEFEPIFTEVDIVNLPKYQILLKLMINGVASDPFSAITMSPNPAFITHNLQKTVRVSQERYTNAVGEVEEKISRWMGAEYHQDAAVLIGSEGEKSQDHELEPLLVSAPTLAEIQQPESVEVRQPQALKYVGEVGQVKVAPQPEAPKVRIENHPPKIVHNQNQAQSHDGKEGDRRHQSDRKHLGRFADSRHQQHASHSNKSHRQSPPQKKENPIWNKVADLQKEKIKDNTEKTRQVVNNILNTPELPQSQPTLEITAPNISTPPPNDNMRKVLKPGESQKM